jgi:hypothetical protein
MEEVTILVYYAQPISVTSPKCALAISCDEVSSAVNCHNCSSAIYGDKAPVVGTNDRSAINIYR